MKKIPYYIGAILASIGIIFLVAVIIASLGFKHVTFLGGGFLLYIFIPLTWNYIISLYKKKYGLQQNKEF